MIPFCVPASSWITARLGIHAVILALLNAPAFKFLRALESLDDTIKALQPRTAVVESSPGSGISAAE